ncbi:unnamed protein product [Gadus morhua 'NCC']
MGLEYIKLVEQTCLSACQLLCQPGVPQTLPCLSERGRREGLTCHSFASCSSAILWAQLFVLTGSSVPCFKLVEQTCLSACQLLCQPGVPQTLPCLSERGRREGLTCHSFASCLLSYPLGTAVCAHRLLRPVF